MQVKDLEDQDRARWDEYFHRSGQSTFFHLAGWQQVKGTPPPGLRFFRNVIGRFPGNVILQVVQGERQILGGGFVALLKDTVYCTWAETLRQFYALRPNHLLCWETMRLGFERGYRWVELGRSRRDSGSFAFKNEWGGEPRTLYQHYYLNGARRPPPVGNDMDDEPRYRLFAALWQRLPLSATQVLGPWLRKQMPFG